MTENAGRPNQTRPYVLAISAGDTLTLAVTGRWVYHRGGGAVTVETDTGDRVDLASGEGQELADFNSIRVYNPAAGSITCTLQIGHGRFYGRTVAGQVEIIPAATVTDPPPVVIGAGATEQLLAADTDRAGSILVADPANAGPVYLVTDNAGTVKGVPLFAGQSLPVNTQAELRGFNNGASAATVYILNGGY